MANVLSTALTALRQGFVDYLSLDYAKMRGTTSGNGGAAGATFVDTALAIFPDNRLNLHWGYITSGTYSGQIRSVSSFTSSSGTVTPLTAYGGQIVSGVTYEVVPFHPTSDILPCLNAALLQVYPNLGRQITDYSLITGNWLPGSPQDWEGATTLRYWALAGAGAALAQETTIIRFGPKTPKLTRVGTDCYLECSDTQWKELLNLGGHEVRFEAWVYATVAARARLNVVVNGASVGASTQNASGSGATDANGYHVGDSTWQLLRTEAITLTDSPNTVSFHMECNTGNTSVYFDRWRVIGPFLNRHSLPLTFSQGQPVQVGIQRVGTQRGNERPCDDLGPGAWPYQDVANVNTFYDDRLGARMLEFATQPEPGYTIRLKGVEYMSTLSAESDTIPFKAPQTYIVYAKAAQELYRRTGDLAKSQFYEGEFAKLVSRFGDPVPVPRRNFSQEKW